MFPWVVVKFGVAGRALVAEFSMSLSRVAGMFDHVSGVFAAAATQVCIPRAGIRIQAGRAEANGSYKKGGPALRHRQRLTR